MPRPGAAQGSGTYTDPVTGMEFVYVKGGCFQMGDTFGDCGSDEKPVHEVCVGDLHVGKFEVTQGQWQQVMGSNPSKFKNGVPYPVERVSWNDVQEFITRLNQKAGKQYRLPTEADWEYGCRSGWQNEKYCGVGNVDSLAWYMTNSSKSTHPVGTKQANGLGLYDMSGNVWEWCSDRYVEGYYSSSPRSNPQGRSSGSIRIVRGGSWFSYPRNVQFSAGEQVGRVSSLNPTYLLCP